MNVNGLIAQIQRLLFPNGHRESSQHLLTISFWSFSRFAQHKRHNVFQLKIPAGVRSFAFNSQRKLFKFHALFWFDNSESSRLIGRNSQREPIRNYREQFAFPVRKHFSGSANFSGSGIELTLLVDISLKRVWRAAELERKKATLITTLICAL